MKGPSGFTYFGDSIANAGDVNGDGYDDAIVGAPYFNSNSNGLTNPALLLFHGSPSGLQTSNPSIIYSQTGGALFGIVHASAGDVNGDGYDDVIVGNRIGSVGGHALLYYGSPSGLELTPAWIYSPMQPSANAGSSVSGAGDVNGDGFDDVLVGAPQYKNTVPEEGAAFLFLGSATGLSFTPAQTFTAAQHKSDFGDSVSKAGDVNGDGFDDILIGAPYYDDNDFDNGRAFLYLGSPSGPSNTPSWTSPQAPRRSRYGTPVCNAGDVNGDGYDDILIGGKNSAFNTAGPYSPVILFLGSANGPLNTAAASFPSSRGTTYFPTGLASAGDTNGDGYDEFLIGDAGPNAPGQLFLYRGSKEGISSQPSEVVNSPVSALGFARSVSGDADFNGDGLADVLASVGVIGSSQYVYGFYGKPEANRRAFGNVLNGSGINPICLSSQAPIIGRSWDSLIDTSVRPAASFAALAVRAKASAGLNVPGGELLLDLGSGKVGTLLQPATASGAAFSIRLPADPALAGLTATAQGIVFGSGYTLCNAYSFRVGF